ncbi:MAG: Sir2 family NAD-dependent protein deacetylase [Lentilitoribacter sp.]
MNIDSIEESRDALTQAIGEAESICFFTGAGISTHSGIPDFRSPGGIWSQYRIIEYSEFVSSEEARREDWDRRFHMAELFAKAKPNAAHVFIADLIAQGRANGVITQNIDGLHQRAGVSDEHVVEFHGTGAYAHCLSCGRRHEIEQVQGHIDETGNIPNCECGGLIKAAVVSFGENLPVSNIERAESMLETTDLMIVIGSSLQVWPASGLLELALRRDAALIIINRDATPFDASAELVLRGDLVEITRGIAA